MKLMETMSLIFQNFTNKNMPQLLHLKIIQMLFTVNTSTCITYIQCTYISLRAIGFLSLISKMPQLFWRGVLKVYQNIKHHTWTLECTIIKDLDLVPVILHVVLSIIFNTCINNSQAKQNTYQEHMDCLFQIQCRKMATFYFFPIP